MLVLTSCDGSVDRKNGIPTVFVDNFYYSIPSPGKLPFCPATSGGNVHGYVFYIDNSSTSCPKKTGDSQRYVSVWGDFNTLDLLGSGIYSRYCEDSNEIHAAGQGSGSNNLTNSEEGKKLHCEKYLGNRKEIIKLIGLDSKKRLAFAMESRSKPDVYLIARLVTNKNNYVNDMKVLDEIVRGISYH